MEKELNWLKGISRLAAVAMAFGAFANAQTISSISPAIADRNSASFTMNVTGYGFVPASVVQWVNGGFITNLATTYSSGTSLSANVPANLLTTAGTVQVQVVNPASTSPTVNFVVAGITMSTSNPTAVPAGTQGINLTINGSGFTINGPTAFYWISPNSSTLVPLSFFLPPTNTQVVLTVPASLLTTAGVATVRAVRGSLSQDYSFPILGNQQFPLTAVVSPANSGTVSGTGLYQAGTTALLKATPNSGYTFAGWGSTSFSTVSYNCTPYPVSFQGGNSAAPSTIVCPGFTLPNTTLTDVLVSYSADYQYGNSGANTVKVNFAPSAANGVIWTAPSTSLTVVGGVSSTSAQSGGVYASNSPSIPSFSSGFPVNVSSSVTSGGVGVSSAAVQVVYSYSGTATAGTANPLPVLINGPVAYTANFQAVSPQISGIALPNAFVGQPITLTISGSGFSSNAFALFTLNGVTSTYPVNFINDGQLTVTIPGNAVNAPGTASIVIQNGPGGLASAPFIIQIMPSASGGGSSINVTNISPGNTAAGTGPIAVTLTGTGFPAGALVQMNGGTIQPTSISSTQLVFIVPASVTNFPGIYPFTVIDPTSQNVSNGLSFGVRLQISASPTTIIAGSQNVTLTVSAPGGFVQGISRIIYNGAPLTTQFVSAQQLTAVLPNASLVSPGTNTVYVDNGNGNLSNTVNISVVTALNSPVITSITPSQAFINDPDTVVVITGTGFKPDARVNFIPPFGVSVPLTPSAVSSTSITVTIPSALLGAAGNGSISVTNVKDNITSPSLVFFIKGKAAVSSVSPNPIPAGLNATLTVSGTGFSFTDLVYLAPPGCASAACATSLLSTYVNATTFTATVLASMVPQTGAYSVFIVSPNSAASSAVTLNVSLQLLSLAPQQVVQNTTLAQQITITSTGGFTPNSVVYFNGTPVQSVFSSATQIVATLPVGAIANAGTYPVTVQNGSIQSNALPFVVLANGQLISISPSSAVAGSAFFNITVNGVGFNSSSQIVFGSTTLATNVISSQVLAATVPAALIATAGSITVGVTNVANTMNFQVTLQATSLSPSTIAAGSAAFPLTVNLVGGVTPNSVVFYGGTQLQIVSFTATSIIATVPASLITTAGTKLVYVQDGNVQSNSLNQIITSGNGRGPTLTSLIPSVVTAGSTGVSLIVNGSGFADGTGVSLNGIPAPTTFISSTVLSVAVPDSVVASAGIVQVTAVTSAGLVSNALPLTVLPPISVTSIAPNSAIAGAAQFSITITGSGFDTRDFVTWTAGSVVTSLTTTYLSSTQLQAIVPANLVATAGSARVGVSDDRGRSSATTALFTINTCTSLACGGGGTLTGTLSISNLSPNSGPTGSAISLTITGTGFIPPSTQGNVPVNVRFGNNPAIVATNVTATTVTVTIPASYLSQVGVVNVAVSQPTLEATSNFLPFTIVNPNPNPYINTISPSNVSLNQTGVLLQVNGGNYFPGSVIYLGGSPVSTTYVNSGLLTTVLPSFSNPVGLNVQVFNPNGVGSNILLLIVGRSNSGVTLISVGPGPLAAGSPTLTITAGGSGFQNGAVVNFGGTNLVTTFVNSFTLTATLPASLITTAGTYWVGVTNPDGTFSNLVPFLVVNKAFIISITPTSISQGAPQFSLAVNGGAFVSGSTVRFNGTNLSTSFTSANQLTAIVPASLVTIPGTYNVTVVNPDGSVSEPALFTVLPFSLSSISPASANSGGSGFTMTLSGVGFLSGATASFNGTALSTSFISSNTLTASVPANLIQIPGTFNVTVTNPDGAVAGPLPFTVRSSISLTSINPGSAVQGSDGLTVTAIGTGFVNGALINFGNSTIATSFNSPTSLTGSVTADLLTRQGTISVTVTNPDGSTSNAVTFTVTQPPPPTITSLSPATAIAGSNQTLTITINGSGFVQGASVQFGTFSGLSNFLSSTQIEVSFPAAALATAGPTPVQVTNPNGDKSNIVNFLLAPPLSITQLSPAAAWAGAGDTLMRVTGVSFVQGATIKFGTTSLPTTYVNGTQLTGTIPASLLAQASSTNVTVVNPDGTVSNALPFTVISLPTLSISANLTASGVNQVILSLDSAAPVDLTGTVGLTFMTNNVNTPAGYVDPAMQFASGGTSIPFTIAQGSKTAVFPNNGAFSPGSVSGTLTLTLTSFKSGNDSVLGSPAPSKSFTIGNQAPIITPNTAKIINGTSGGFTVEVIGFSTTRELSKVNFTFITNGSISIDGGGSFTIDVTQAFNTYFSSDNGLKNGGTFKMDIPFTITGADASAITGATLTLVNSVGASVSVTASR